MNFLFAGGSSSEEDEIHVNRTLTEAEDWTTVLVVSSWHRNEKNIS